MNRMWRPEFLWPGLLIVVGLYFLLHNLGLLEWVRAEIFWPVILIALGVWLILRRVRT